MKIALFSDIHGNCIALEAVLADVERQGGVDEYWVLGDLVAVGTQPIQVLERLASLPTVRYTRGNTDRYITEGHRPPPFPKTVESDLTKLPVFEEVALTMAWTQGAAIATGWMPFLKSLPLEQHLTLPDGSRLLGVHASPGEDNSRGIRPDYEAGEVQERFSGIDADIICVGHTHWPMNTHVEDEATGKHHVINLGSVGNPRVPHLEAWYVMLEVGSDGYQITHHAVAYDIDKSIQMVEDVQHPAGGFILKFLRGQRIYPFGESQLPSVTR
ncbi:MAG: metallophosphoesterase [Chloroflexota bacterium]